MPTSILELRHLKTLLSIERTGSISRAANMLHLTQSAVSHQIKALESHYGETLLVRHSGETRFTALGTRLLDLAHSVVPQIEQTELDIGKQKEGASGPLRIAVECHTCFDWLMPSMDEYRTRWPEVELDIVSGFQADPVGLVHRAEAELAIVSEPPCEQGIADSPLFSYEIVGVVAKDSSFVQKAYLTPQDFANQTLITYPVPDDMLDVLKHFLHPAGIYPNRRSSELTVAILQLVASRRGVSALPGWAVKSYVERGYVASVPLGKKGLQASLYAATTEHLHQKLYVQDFIDIMRLVSACELDGVQPLLDTHQS